MVEDCDTSSASSDLYEPYTHASDPLDEESDEDDDDSSDYDDSEVDSDEEWILFNPRPSQQDGQANATGAALKQTLHRRFPCGHCEKVFKTSSDRNRHLLIHAQVKRFVCDQCGKPFTRKQDMQRHLVSHAAKTATSTSVSTSSSASSPSSVDAGECKVTTTSASSSPSPATPQRFACDYPGCLKSYTMRNNLTRHRKTHGPSPSGCSPPREGEAESGSRQTSPLSSPAPSPSAAAPQGFVCDHPGCGKSFSLRNNLARHRKLHAGASYPCPECGKSFTQASDLKRHASIHSDERRFACHLCPRTFRQKAHLAVHLRSKAHSPKSS